MAKRPPRRVIDPAARELAAHVAREVRARCGPDSTFEQRRDMAAKVARELLSEVDAASGLKPKE
jgi:hypothetical protein